MSTATWVCFIHADQLHQETDNDSVTAPRICCTGTDTRRWPGDDRHPVQASVPTPVHRSETGRDLADTC
jgi:hypothetical protein